MVLRRMQDTLERAVFSNEGFDTNGDWNEGTATFVDKTPCDAVASNGKATILSDDGVQRVSYSYTVYLPKEYEHDFEVGEKVRLTRFNGVSGEFSVKGYQPYQLQKKIWL